MGYFIYDHIGPQKLTGKSPGNCLPRVDYSLDGSTILVNLYLKMKNFVENAKNIC
jgi:hypothetical protein